MAAGLGWGEYGEGKRCWLWGFGLSNWMDSDAAYWDGQDCMESRSLTSFGNMLSHASFRNMIHIQVLSVHRPLRFFPSKWNAESNYILGESETVITVLHIFTGTDLETQSTNIIPAMSSPHPVSACPFRWGPQHTLCNTYIQTYTHT